MTQSLFKAEIAFSLFKEVETRVEFSISFSGRVDLATDKKEEEEVAFDAHGRFRKALPVGLPGKTASSSAEAKEIDPR